MKALSIRQPWAWLIVNGYKPVENRNWKTNYRGKILVHASSTMSFDNYSVAHEIAKQNGINIPHESEYNFGGIIGETEIVDCVTQHDSPFFFGPFGFVLENSYPLSFHPCKGKLGLFDVKEYGNDKQC